MLAIESLGGASPWSQVALFLWFLSVFFFSSLRVTLTLALLLSLLTCFGGFRLKVSEWRRTDYGETLGSVHLWSLWLLHFYFKDQSNNHLPSFQFLKSNIITTLLGKQVDSHF